MVSQPKCETFDNQKKTNETHSLLKFYENYIVTV